VIGYLLVLIFGWHRIPERFVTRGMEFITLFLKDLGTGDERALPPECLRALSQLAYRRAGKEPNRQPRLFFYVRELKRVSSSVHALIKGCGSADGEIRSILLWHGVDCVPDEPDKAPLRMPVSGAPAAAAPVVPPPGIAGL
jgi:hypothetical protein